MLRAKEQTQPAESTEARKQYSRRRHAGEAASRAGSTEVSSRARIQGAVHNEGRCGRGRMYGPNGADGVGDGVRSFSKSSEAHKACLIDDCRLEYSRSSWSGLVCVGAGVGLGTLLDLPKVAVDG